MKKYILSLLFCAIGVSVWGQVNQLPLTYEKAIQIGLQNNKQLQAQRLNIQLQEVEAEKNKSRQLPTVTGSYDFRYNTQLQTSVIPANAFPTQPGQEAQDRRIQFGTRFNHTLAVNVNQPIYQPNNHSDREVTTQNRLIEQQSLQKTESELRLSIAQAYYAVLWNEEKAKLSAANVTRTRTYYQTAGIRFQNGTILKTDLDRFYLDIVNAETAHRRDSVVLSQSKEQLAYQLSLNALTEPVLTENLPDKVNNMAMPILGDQPTRERIELTLENSRLQLNALNLKREQRNYYPGVSAYGNYSVQQLNNDLNIFNGDRWTSFNYIGLNVSVPIFDGMLKERNKSTHRLRMEINKANLERLNNDVRFEVQTARTELVNATLNYDYATKNLTLARQILQTDRKKHEEGTLLYQDLRASEYALQQAETNLLNVLYDYVIARLKWEKAAGVL